MKKQRVSQWTDRESKKHISKYKKHVETVVDNFVDNNILNVEKWITTASLGP